MDRQIRQLISRAHKQVASSKLAYERSEKKIARPRILIEASKVPFTKRV